MDLADGGDLQSKINHYKRINSIIPEKEIWRYFIQMVTGLEALHEKKIVHRDIKCANLFLTKSGILKLGDLNVSKVAKRGLLHTQTGTPYYASPEVWQDKPYDYKSDIWSMGCVLYELCALNPPFRAADMKGLYYKVIKGQYPPIPASYSQDLQNMVKALLQINPSNRPTCTKILTMPGTHSHLSMTLVNQMD
jgi:NIMA (never in mitosis gene a)-related kinase